MMRFRRAMAVLFCLASFTTVNLLHAQGGGSTGTILGSVTDNTGAVVAGADVQVTSTETGISENLKTTSTGEYQVSYLHPGLYRVTVQAPGFQKAVVEGVILTVDQRSRQDVKLAVGSESQSIEVSSTQLSLDTDTAEIAQVISSRQVVDLPINSRNFVALLFLTEGAVEMGGTESQGSSTSAKGNGGISLNGGRMASNQYLIDGMYNNDTIFQQPAISPSIDAIQEFKTQSGAYSAEFGGSANQVNISFRSGTNSLHGTAFEFDRNDAFDAYSYFDAAKHQGDKTQKKPLLRQNQFGYTLGGPIWIPKFYDGRDKSFFFANYEGLRIHQSATGQALVPHQAELGLGTPDGSAIIPQSLVASGVLKNPATGVPYPKDANGNFVIPPSDFSNFGKNARLHIPKAGANVFSSSGVLQSDYNWSLAVPTTADQQNYRFDQHLGQKNAFFFRYSRADYTATGAGYGVLPEAEQFSVSTQRSYQGGYTRTFSPNLVNQVRFGYLKSVNNLLAATVPQADIDALAFQNVYVQAPVYPQLEFGNSAIGYSTLGGAINLPSVFNQPTWDLTNSLTINHGRHTISAGIGWRLLTLHDSASGEGYGTFNFSGASSGATVADILLGYAATTANPLPTPFTSKSGAFVNIPHWFLAPYVQDDWKVTPKLTVNAGLRYDFQSVPYNTTKQFGFFDQDAGVLKVADKSLISGGFNPGVYVYAGGDTAYSAQKEVLAPRFGFAYRPVDKFVFRGGYGLFFDSSEDSETHQFGNYFPYNSSYSKASPQQIDGLYPGFSLTSKVSVDGQYFTQNAKHSNPYVQSFDLSVERQITSAATIEIHYLGNIGRHLIGRNSVNTPYVFDPANPGFNPLDKASADASFIARTPFKNFSQTDANGGYTSFSRIILDSNNLSSNYHSFNVKGQLNEHGLNILAIYTWSKAMDEKSAASSVGGDGAGWVNTEDPHNPARDYARSSYDVGQRFVISAIYDLPIGKGKALNVSRPLDVILGGWQLNTITTFQGGFPFSVVANDNTGAYTDFGGFLGDNFAQRANQVAKIKIPKKVTEWFDPTSFSTPSFFSAPVTDPRTGVTTLVPVAGGVYGNSSRNSIRGPGVNNWDSSIFKNTKIGERINAQFRIEAFNALNHTQLGSPNQNASNTDSNGLQTAGIINSTRAPGRIVQLGAKIIF